MIGGTLQVRVWACAEPVSMRKSFDGLYAAAKTALGRGTYSPWPIVTG